MTAVLFHVREIVAKMVATTDGILAVDDMHTYRTVQHWLEVNKLATYMPVPGDTSRKLDVLARFFAYVGVDPDTFIEKPPATACDVLSGRQYTAASPAPRSRDDDDCEPSRVGAQPWCAQELYREEPDDQTREDLLRHWIESLGLPAGESVRGGEHRARIPDQQRHRRDGQAIPGGVRQ